MIFFKIDDKFPDSTIVFVDSSINATKVIQLNKSKISCLVDENNNVKLINYYEPIKLDRTYGFLPIDLQNSIISKIKNENKELMFNKKEFFKLGKIIKREKHPNSDKLALLTVDYKKFKNQIITNTTFTNEDKFFIFALEGAITAQGDEIKSGKILSIESNGMLASPKALGIKKYDKNNWEEFINLINQSEFINKYWGNDLTEIITKLQGE
ncbi:TyrS-associated PheT N-terminal domain-related protein TapR [Mycoplasmopsis meleagridis]|uniref:TyrS-associated PheT N-terminal domain-related protein TapR n=1 Tax=Mycoplasmopsis meleagridis TaxID=29561 RepID=UPI003A847249